MAMSVQQVKDWLDTLPEDSYVAIDEGGLTLRCSDGWSYLEIGGVPHDLPFPYAED